MKTGRDGSDTPWITYPKRMLGWKPISHHLADVYSDLLGGMTVAEDLIDVEPAGQHDPTPRKSLMAVVSGPVAEDKLLAAGGIKLDANEIIYPKKTEAQIAAAAAEEEEDWARQKAAKKGVTVSAPEPKETDKPGETEPLLGPSGPVGWMAGPSEDADEEKRVEGKFRNLLAQMESESEDYRTLEAHYFRCLTAALKYAPWEKEVETLFKKMLKKFPRAGDTTR
jgi:hypothetical protein